MKGVVRRSIFKQRLYKVKYEICKQHESSSILNTIYHQSIMKTKDEFVKDIDIFTCDLEMPMLEVGEKFYIEGLNKLVEIRDRIRTSEGNICYYIEDDFIEEDEDTLKEKKRLTSILESHKKEREMCDDEIKRLKNEIESLESKKRKKSNWLFGR